MRPSSDEISMMMWRERIPANSLYDTVESTPSIIDDQFSHVLEYESCWFSISVVFTLKYILGLSIFVFGGNDESKNGSLNVVDIAIF